MTHDSPASSANRTRAQQVVVGLVAVLLVLSVVTLSGCDGRGSSDSPQLRSLEITPASPSVAAGTSVQLTATGIYSDNSHADLTAQASWAVSNTAVATVGASTGKALGVVPGTTTLSASLHGFTATTMLTVTSATLVSVAITPPVPSIAAGTSEQFTATGTFSDNTTQDLSADLIWASSNTTVATVSSSGLASTVGPGSATISATCKVASTCGTLAGSATITVTSATLVSIAITPAAASIALGTSEPFTAIGTYSDNSTQTLTTQVTWNSATPAVATISNAAGSAGVATSITPGTTLVTAVLGGVTSAGVTLTVTPATLVSIAITPTGPSIPVAGTEQFVATGTYSDSSTQILTATATWGSSAASIAPISNAAGSQGLATGLVVGPTSISATLGGVTSPAVTLTITAQVESVLYSFTGGNDGVNPEAGMIQAADGNFYGTTYGGGTTGYGTVFEVTPAGVESVLYAFTGGNDGENPQAPLIQAADGNFYGTTGYGGPSNVGTVFKITPAGVETVLYAFTGGNDGAVPYAALIQGADGNFYGTTAFGGQGGAGTVFKITPAGVETVLHAFTGGNDGTVPYAALFQAADGDFYGTTLFGGTSDSGTLFKITPAGVETVLYAFTGGNDGAIPQAPLIQAADGNFYGTTYGGGTTGYGTVFEVTPAGVESVLYAFTGGNDGENPQAPLIQAADGNFYGTTMSGGPSNAGTLFKITPAGVETVLYSFAGGNDGATPQAGLIQGVDGNFYGTTNLGGTSNVGTVFKF